MIPQALGFFGWKRPQVAAKTLRGLARCHGIERWPLIAFLDAGSDPATTKAIEQWTASPLLGIRQSADKLGCSGNLTRGIMDLFDLCSDRFIVLEDDVYPAEGFIDGLRVGLNRFQSAHTIKSIAAYNPSENRKRGICGDVPGFHCWGLGDVGRPPTVLRAGALACPGRCPRRQLGRAAVSASRGPVRCAASLPHAQHRHDRLDAHSGGGSHPRGVGGVGEPPRHPAMKKPRSARQSRGQPHGNKTLRWKDERRVEESQSPDAEGRLEDDVMADTCAFSSSEDRLRYFSSVRIDESSWSTA